MRLILVRHTETVWQSTGARAVIERRTHGVSDVELSEKGLRQAELLATSLKDEEIVAIYSSPLKRASDTAQVITKYHQIEVKIDEGLKEMDQGDLEGLTFTEMGRKYRDLLKKWRENPTSVRMPNGESLEEVQERSWGSIQRITEKHLDGTVVVVSHNFVILTILCKAINLDLNNFRRLRQDIGAKSIIDFGKRGRVLTLLNETSHLSRV